MKVYTTQIKQTELLKNITRLIYSVDNRENILNDISEKINKSKGSIDTFLKEIDSIEDRKIRQNCRLVALAQMFNAKTDYRSGYPCVASSAHSDEVYFLKFQTSTAVVSKYGEVLIDEGLVWINPSANYGLGVPMKSAIDKKWGFIQNSGSKLLPCIFDDIDQHSGEINFLYNHVNFRLRIYGKLENVNKEYLEWLTEYCDSDKTIVCMNKDSIVFTLTQLDLLENDNKYRYVTKEEKKSAIEKVSSELSDIILPKEEIEKYLQ